MMYNDEVEIVIEDLRRATSYVVHPLSAEQVLEQVANDIARIIERLEVSCSRYVSIYPQQVSEG